MTQWTGESVTMDEDTGCGGNTFSQASPAEMATGYLHAAYADSLSEFGRPRPLPKSGGWILERQIPRFPYVDGMGCYPLFACRNWSQLQYDLEALRNEIVSLVLVTDPFGAYDELYLRQCFEDLVIPFKEHNLVDLTRPMNTYLSSHHRRNARNAQKAVDVERCRRPIELLDEWVDLYARLIERHHITGMLAFSKMSFAKQLEVPGLVAFRAVHGGKTVGMMLWYVQEGIGYYHLGAYDDVGYRLKASFALMWYCIDYFAANGLKWLNLGADAGVKSDSSHGLTRFKRGWSTDSRTAYLCGRIFNHNEYGEVVRARGDPLAGYFPAYRKGEFG